MTQLDKTAWLRHGLKVLAREGVEGLKADRLAKSLNISRGSFYWHFANIDAFREEVLDHWAAQSTLAVIGGLDRRGGDGAARLLRLLSLALRSDMRLERAVRTWAAHDDHAARAVRGVDAVRLRYIRRCMVEAGASPAEAEARSALIYFAYIGRTVGGRHAANVTDDGMRLVARILIGGGETAQDPNADQRSSAGAF